MDIYGGMVNQQQLKKMLGFDGRVNPIASKSGRRDAYTRTIANRELQQFVRRYKYKNLPKGLTPELIERVLYFRGRLVLFKMEDTYFSLPFALNGSIDVYGRYNTLSPLTFNGSIMQNEDGDNVLGDDVWIGDLLLKPAYEKECIDGKNAVIINDYTQSISQFIVPRYQLNQIYHEDLANIIILVRHNLISSARVFSVRVLDQGQAEAVMKEFDDMEEDILENAKRIFTVTSPNKIEELFRDKGLETQEYWECYVSLDNLRENLIGIENNGIFKKKERQLKGEQELEASSADLVYEDGLANRRDMFEVFNTLFNENVIVEESDAIQGVEQIVPDNNDRNIEQVPEKTEEE